MEASVEVLVVVLAEVASVSNTVYLDSADFDYFLSSFLVLH